MQPIPESKDDGVVGISFAVDEGMMVAVHARGDEYFVQAAFEGQGQAEITVVEDGAALEDDGVGGEGLRFNAEKRYLHGTEGGGVKNLYEVEAEGGGGVEVGVEVVGIVETPEKRKAVVEPVPIIEGQVEQDKAQDGLQCGWQRGKMQNTQAVGGYVGGQEEGDRSDGECAGGQGKGGHDYVCGEPI